MKKNILFTIHSMPIGGAERVLCNILDNFNYESYDVTLLLYYGYGELLPSVPKEVHVKSLYKEPKFTLFYRCRERLFRVLGLRKILDRVNTRKAVENHYDAIVSFCHGHGHMMHSFIFDRTNNNISWIHSDLSVGNWGVQFFDNELKKQEAAYNKMNTIVYVSNDAKKTFHKVFKLNDNVKEVVIYNFVNEKDIKEKASQSNKNIQKTKFTFINIGRLIEAKNQDRIIKASKSLKDKGYDFEFWVVGDGPLREDLKREIAQNGLKDVVKLLGAQINPYCLLNASDCFVLTSHQEGFSIVIVEAFVLGKPVITMRSSGPIELVGDSEYGLLINQDIDELSCAMEKMMTDKSLYDFYSLQSEKRASFFTGKDSMIQINSILSRTIQ